MKSKQIHSAYVGYQDLRGYLMLLEERALLKRVRVEVDPKHELGAICVKSLRMKGPALLFEKIKGYPGMKLVTNVLSTLEQLAIAFGAEADERKIYQAIEARKDAPVEPRVVKRAPCQEEVHGEEEVDLYKFPTPWWHEADGGRYIGTTAGVITKDPEGGSLNMGMYRVMIKDRDTVTLNIKGPHPVGEILGEGREGVGAAAHILKNEASGKPAPVAIATGMDPALTFVAAQSVDYEGLSHAEYSFAGGIKGEAVEVVSCRTHDLLVPARAEVVLEGEVVPGVRTPEGPHGESQGFYGWNDAAFVAKVRCVTQRKDALHYGLVCGCREDYPKFVKYSGLQAKLMAVNGVREVYEPDLSGGRCRIVVIAVRADSAADVQRIVRAIEEIPGGSRGLFKPRWAVIVDDDCDVRDWEDIIWRMVMSVMPDKDVRIGPRSEPVRHEPMEEFYDRASSVVIDATMRSKGAFPPVNRVSRELMAKVEARWKEYFT
jgi:UbiD family decarboxylase